MKKAVCFCAFFVLFLCVTVSAQETDSRPAEQSEQQASPESEAPSSKVEPPDPCEVGTQGKEPLLEHVRREVFETVCESAQWFDGFFGSRRFDEEARRTNGRVGAQVIYDEHGGAEFDGTFKVRVDFPNLEYRLNAFLGRDDEEAFLTGTENRLDFLPTFFKTESENQWLLGLGYRPVSNKQSAIDFDGGIELDPVDAFVSARYRRYWLVGDENLVRARQTVYWTDQRHLGFGTRVDYEKPLGRVTLARWAGNFKHDDTTEGTDWDTGVTLYHGFSRDRAFSWFVGIDGETGHDPSITNYGTRVTYRQRMLREWFFGEILGGVTWPRDNLDEQREMAWHLGFGFEIYFSGEDLGIGSRQASDERKEERRGRR